MAKSREDLFEPIMEWLRESEHHGCELRHHADGVRITLTDDSGALASTTGSFVLAVRAALESARCRLPAMLRMRAERLRARASETETESRRLAYKATMLDEQADEAVRQMALDGLAK